MNGFHYIKSWSSTQKSITLSSGEAELVALVKLSAELLGVMQLAKDWGLEKGGDVYVDSAAALGVVKRKGNGKLRHIRVGQLWVQEKRETGELGYHKVDGKTNPSDVLTKAVSRQLMEKACELVGKCIADGRAVVGLHL